jgi:hypothetical protein
MHEPNGCLQVDLRKQRMTRTVTADPSGQEESRREALLVKFTLAEARERSKLSAGTAHKAYLAANQNISTERGRASPPCLAHGSSTSSR